MQRYHDGDIYHGETLEGKPNGKGSMIYANGRLKYGDWVTGQSTDKGILAFRCSD